MRLVACHSCHAQLDVTRVDQARVRCACGAEVENRTPTPLDIPIHRCAACGGALDTDATECGFCGAAVVRDPSRLGLVCPECFARTVEAGRFCTACGVAIRPQAVGDMSPLACPACDQTLGRVALGRIAIHECPGCGGSWVCNDDFDDIVARVQERTADRASRGLAGTPRTAAIDAAQAVAYRPCPECTQIMHRRNFGRVSGVIVDWCRAHGTWLDAAELEAVADFVSSGGLDDRAVVDQTTTATVTTNTLDAERLLENMKGTRARSFVDLLIDVLS